MMAKNGGAMIDLLELSDSEFLSWAGAQRQRWALLPGWRREAWLDHLVARMQMTADTDERDECWRLAHVIASADSATAAESPR